MKTPLHFIFILTVFVFAASCSGSKAYYKKGQKLEKSGLTTEASNFYIEALKRKKSNEDAIIALKKTGQEVLDKQYSKFYQSFTAERYRDAVYSYLDAEQFKSKVEAVGVKLESPAYYKDYYNEARDIYIAELYDEAKIDLDDEDFEQAENILSEIKRLDPTYRNVRELSDFAFVEPKYRQALHAYDYQRYREAYHLFKAINDRSGGYKESLDYQELALESAQFPIGILPIENKTGVRNIESGISGSIIRDIKDLNDPFLRIVDRTQTDALLEEQFYNMSGAIEQSTAIQTGTLLGSKAILVGKVVSARIDEGKLKKSSRTGWLGKEVRYIDQQGTKRTKLVFDKVYYQEYEQENSVTCTFQYQLISTETGEVLASDLLEISRTDALNYADFKGNTKYLFAGYWTNQYRKAPNDRRYGSYSEKREFDRLLAADRNIESTEELMNEAYEEIGQAVANKLKGFNPEAL